MKNNYTSFFIRCLSIWILSFSLTAYAATGFVVQDIQVKGLERVHAGTVLNYLPIQAGERLEPEQTAGIIRALYDTGFFQAVSLSRSGNTLIVHVVERATIGSISVVGNEEIPKDAMKELLKNLGLVKGHIFQRAVLERLEKELEQAYTERGKYNARINTQVTPLTESRVAITITISEGRVSRIKTITFVGNKEFSDSDLLPEMSLSTSNFFTYFSKKDQYSQPAMDASLEAIRSYYMDRGYLHFKIVSSQVLLSPDKKDVFITIHVKEGAQYHFSGFALKGNTVISPEDMRKKVLVQPGNVFSRKQVTESISAIGDTLGDVGYGFPVIQADPRIDEEHKTVFITFIIEPGRHVYVRRIQFHGNTKTGDYVLRSAIRQDEGALLSLRNIKESERQLRMLGYLKNASVKTVPVADANNQVDLDVDVEEGPSAEAKASLGYGTNGPQFNASFDQHNFMGTGRAVGIGFNASYWGQDYTMHYFNPFATTTGIGFGADFYFRTVDPQHLDVSAYSSDKFGGDAYYNILLSEKSSLQLGYGYQGLNITNAGNVLQIQNFVDLYGGNFQEIRLTGGWNRNTYDQMPFPTSGVNQQLSMLTALAGTEKSLRYYKGSYMIHWFQPLFSGFIFNVLGNVAYGNQYNNQGLPFFENYFAGGIAQPGEVRGYDSFSLGPQDNYGRSLGANFLTSGTLALILPYPISRDTVRTSVFMDAGNVFSYGLPEALQGTDAGPIRYSAGLSIEWRSPFGPLAFSVAKAINPQPLDKLQFFQFTVSSAV